MLSTSKLVKNIGCASLNICNILFGMKIRILVLIFYLVSSGTSAHFCVSLRELACCFINARQIFVIPRGNNIGICRRRFGTSYIYFTIDVDRLIIKIREKSDFIFKVTKKAVVEVIYAGKVSQ